MKDFNGIKYIEVGNKGGENIVFIHGFPFDHTMWDHQTAYFSENHNVVLYDVRGLGDSEAGNGQYTMELFVDDLHELLSHLEIKNPILCGLSMGGYLALRYAEKFGGLKALILCDTKSEADNDLAKLKRADGIRNIKNNGLSGFIEGFIPGLLANADTEETNVLKADLINRSNSFEPKGVIGCLLAMLSRTDTTEYLSKIDFPTLVLCGEEDNFTPPAVMKEMADKIKDSKFVPIPEAGHIAPLEKPEQTNKIINEFITELNN